MESYISCGSEENVTIKDRYGYPVIVTRAKVSWDPCGYNITIPELPFEKPIETTEITSVTIIGNSSNSISYLKTYTRAKVTKGPDGYTVEILPAPKFTIGDLFVISSGKLGKVISAPDYINGKYTYEIQWTDGKKNKCQPEDSMIKLEESF